MLKQTSQCLFRISILILFLGTITIVPTANADQAPVDVIYDFYDAIAKKNCEKAIKLRPGYSKSECRKIIYIEVVNAKSVLRIDNNQNESIADIDLTVKYRKATTPEIFSGYVTIRKDSSGVWKIDNNSYRSKSTASFDKQQDKLPNSDQLTTARSKEGDDLLDPKKTQHYNDKITYQENSNLTFGSDRILQNCWLPAELEGSDSDKKIIKPLPSRYRDQIEKQEPQGIPPALPPDHRKSIRYVIPDGNKKIVALTFDLCEQANEKTGYDKDIVNYLRQNKIKATFFAGGKWMYSHPEKTMQLMADPLFEVGNHTWTHGNLRVLKGKQMRDQIIWTQAQYELLWEELKNKDCVINKAGIDQMNFIPTLPRVFRFPYGTCDMESLNAVAELGLAAVQWNIVTGDPARGQTAKRIADTILQQIKPGSIIIAHANGRGWNTAGALSLFIPELHRRGYEFVTVSELLNSGKVVTADTCYEMKPGDNLKYDKNFGDQ